MNGLYSQTGYASPKTCALQAEFCATGVQSSSCMCSAQEHKRERNSKHKYAPTYSNKYDHFHNAHTKTSQSINYLARKCIMCVYIFLTHQLHFFFWRALLQDKRVTERPALASKGEPSRQQGIRLLAFYPHSSDRRRSYKLHISIAPIQELCTMMVALMTP